MFHSVPEVDERGGFGPARPARPGILRWMNTRRTPRHAQACQLEESMPRFELIGGGSSKFWEITLNDTVVLARWGRIGSAGQQKEKPFDSKDEARKAYDKLAPSTSSRSRHSIDAPIPWMTSSPPSTRRRASPREPRLSPPSRRRGSCTRRASSKRRCSGPPRKCWSGWARPAGEASFNISAASAAQSSACGQRPNRCWRASQRTS